MARTDGDQSRQRVFCRAGGREGDDPAQARRIINICSVQSELARTNIAPYTASKGAVKMLTKGMATDWGKHGIAHQRHRARLFPHRAQQGAGRGRKVLGWLTARTPMRRWADVEELDGAAVFLASDASSFVNGHVLYVDGGITACLSASAPELAHKSVLGRTAHKACLWRY